MTDIERQGMNTVVAGIKRCNRNIEALENVCWVMDREGEHVAMNHIERADLIMEAKQDREKYLEHLRTYQWEFCPPSYIHRVWYTVE